MLAGVEGKCARTPSETETREQLSFFALIYQESSKNIWPNHSFTFRPYLRSLSQAHLTKPHMSCLVYPPHQQLGSPL
jgi:hypothetical protein